MGRVPEGAAAPPEMTWKVAWLGKGKGTMISHKYRGSCVAFSISKSVEPNEELKVG
jgi:hypothetical protein